MLLRVTHFITEQLLPVERPVSSVVLQFSGPVQLAGATGQSRSFGLTPTWPRWDLPSVVETHYHMPGGFNSTKALAYCSAGLKSNLGLLGLKSRHGRATLLSGDSRGLPGPLRLAGFGSGLAEGWASTPSWLSAAVTLATGGLSQAPAQHRHTWNQHEGVESSGCHLSDPCVPSPSTWKDSRGYSGPTGHVCKASSATSGDSCTGSWVDICRDLSLLHKPNPNHLFLRLLGGKS